MVVLWYLVFMVSMNTKMMFWNCQGMGHPRFHNFVAEYRRELNLDIICFVETRMSSEKADNIINRLGFDNSYRIKVVGFASGIWILWKDTVMIDVVDLHNQAITFNVRDRVGASDFTVSAIYASPHSSTGRFLWDYLSSLDLKVEGSWMIAGDFNCILEAFE